MLAVRVEACSSGYLDWVTEPSDIVHTIDVDNGESDSVTKAVCEHKNTYNTNWTACTNKLKTYVQMNLNGDWMTVIGDDTRYSSLGSGADLMYIDNWMESNSET